MMKRALHKLRSRRGESLMEVLIAILIMALSCAMIAGVTRAAILINRRASDATEKFYTDMSRAQQSSTSSGTLTVAGTGGVGSVDIPITISGTADGLRAYTLVEGTP